MHSEYKISSFLSNILWFTQSNAFFRSQKTPPTIQLLITPFRISFNTTYEAIWMDVVDLKPRCSLVIKVLVDVWSYNLVQINFSNVLENDVSMEIGL